MRIQLTSVAFASVSNIASLTGTDMRVCSIPAVGVGSTRVSLATPRNVAAGNGAG